MMKTNVCDLIQSLMEYAVKEGLIEQSDRIWSRNRLMQLLAVDDFRPTSENCEEIAMHAAWVEGFAHRYDFQKEDVVSIFQQEIGKTFEAVLEDAGVYKCTQEGTAAFLRFLNTV